MKGILLLALVVMASMPAQAQDARSAEAFLRALYAPAEPSRGRPFWDAAATRAVATPSLAALRQRDLDAQQAADEPSDLNFDPLCGCQDDEGLRLVGVAIREVRSGRATATVTLRIAASQVILRMDLAAIGRDWRIDNILGEVDGRGWDLRALLTRSIANRRAPPTAR